MLHPSEQRRTAAHGGRPLPATALLPRPPCAARTPSSKRTLRSTISAVDRRHVGVDRIARFPILLQFIAQRANADAELRRSLRAITIRLPQCGTDRLFLE